MVHKLRKYSKTEALVQIKFYRGEKIWQAFENVCKNFLANKKTENYSEIVQELISSYSGVGCNMSLKLHFLHSHFISSKHGSYRRWS